MDQDVPREIEFAPGNQWEATYLTRVHLDGQSGTRRFLLTYKSPLDIDCLAPMNDGGGFYREAAAFVRHGIAHILTGYDHLLFVAMSDGGGGFGDPCLQSGRRDRAPGSGAAVFCGAAAA